MGWADAPKVDEGNKWSAAPLADEPQNSLTETVAQFGDGSQSGIARAFGFPVDAITGAINGVGNLTGYGDVIQNPVGGSQSIQSGINAVMEPFGYRIQDPQTAIQRAARRIGEEVGGTAAMAPLALASAPGRAAPWATAAVEGMSALGSGTGASIANEMFPDSPAADIIGALLGGGLGGYGMGRALAMNGTDAVVRPGIEDQRMRAADAYGEVRSDQRVLPQSDVFDLGLDVDYRMAQERLNPRLQPGASAVRDALVDDVMNPMRIEDVENLRRLTQQGLPVTASPADQRLAGIMRDQITDYLDNLDDPVADALRTGRDAHRRASAAQSIADAETKAARRAASTGSGGNEINAMRQNLRSVLDNPRKARSFKPDELAQMAEIVSGSGGQNAMRRLSRFAPSSGGLSSMLGIGGAMASPGVALPIMAATEAAKALGERSTRNSISQLLQSLAPDRVLSPGQQGIAPIIAALLGARTIANDE